ncbi:hypothetical protein FNV43_RR14322 [Rhamnella rubrinervis]|uniref:Uncharacterized protein n=1 Tax=Rhamnella rubrinervis TaxID=2594499 RepID=A0A8K0H2X3_9ROSA|nr:hypothetical protein FNV43_RR14322 [Rhamnella rubrinervis]
MRCRKSARAVICLVLVLLEGVLLLRASSNLQAASSSENVFFKIWRSSNNSAYSNGMGRNFRHRRFFGHGFRLRGSHVDEEQKRITPNGANPLHNRF